MKPRDKSVSNQKFRMKELTRYSRALEGPRANLIKDVQKITLFSSFPVAWQINIKWTQTSIHVSIVEAMMVYIKQKEEFSAFKFRLIKNICSLKI